MFKISIITINFNNRKGLDNTIASVVNQTSADFEYIVIDGGSTDESFEVIKQYQDKITSCVSEKDKGVYDAMNKGITKATGDYLIFLNSGDCLNGSTTIKKCYEYINQFPGTDIFYGDIIVVNDKHNAVPWLRNYPGALTLNYFKKSTINHQATIIKAELFKQLGLYPDQYKLASDYWFFLTSLLNNKAYQYLNFPMVIYDNNGISANNMDKYLFEKQEIWNKLVPKCVQDVISENERYEHLMEYTLVKIGIRLNKNYQKLRHK